MNCIIGVDIGTTSTKTIAFTPSGKILAQSAQRYPVHSPSSTYAEQDPEEIFEAVLHTIKTTWGTLNGSYSLDGISFSSAMHGIMPVDIDGKPLMNCIIWADTRSKEIAKSIKGGSSGNYLYQRTGTPVHPMSPLCKIVWIKENMPEVFDKAFKFISIKEYVFLKFFNKYLIDYSIASCTGLFDIYDHQWNDVAMNTAGISPLKLSMPVPSEHIEVNLNKKYANHLDIPEGVPFIIGANDGCLANLGSNAISKGRAAVTIGTSGAIRMAFPQPILDPRERIFNYMLTKGCYISGGPVNNGGIVLQWFFEKVRWPRSGNDLPGDINDYTKELEGASSISAGADGLVFLPYLLGERAPHWDADARGVFFGLNINHTHAHIIKAIQEGVVYGVLSVAEALENSSETIETIYANGGFAKSENWIQILADVFGKKVLVSESVESSAWGAAVMGLFALGQISRLDDPSCFQEQLREITPNVENHRVYKKTFSLFKRLYEKLKDEFSTLNALQT